MGGLAYVLSVNPRVKIYAPKESFGVYGGDLPGTFYRRDPSLAPEQRYYDGAPPEVMIATQLFVVPRSIPMILLILICLRASELN